MIRKQFLFLALIGSLQAQSDIPLHKPVIYQPDGRVYTAAQKAVQKNDAAIAVQGRTSDQLFGITPEKVTLNGKEDQLNPLFGAKIDHLVMLARRPLAAIGSTIYLTDERVNPLLVFESPKIRNAYAQEVSELLALTSNASDVTIGLPAGAGLAAFAAVPNSQGQFDGNGSGIASALFRSVLNRETTTSFMAWDVIDATTGASSFTRDGKPSLKGNKAAPFGKDTQALFIGEPVTAIRNDIDLHFDRDIGRLYMALDVDASVGARAIVAVALSEQGKVLYVPIAPESAFSEESAIVGKKAPGQIGISFVRTMQTRTYVRYLIVVDSENGVYALPLVDNIASVAHGTLANVKKPPVPGFSRVAPHRFESRVFIEPATEPDQLFTTHSVQAKVGGNGSLPGRITDITVSSESVMVATKEDSIQKGQIAQGMFFSQPVFDRYGAISSWTEWQRVAGDQSVKGFAYDSGTAQHSYVSLEDDTRIKRTSWTVGDDGLDRLISGNFPKEQGGVLGLIDFPFSTKGFSQDVGTRIGIQVFTGAHGVALIQTGADYNGVFRPRIDARTVLQSTNGTLQGFNNQPSLVISGGDLDAIGPLTTAAVVSGESTWFVVGGSYGLAVLADSTGHGWTSLTKGFGGLTQDHAWRRISTTRNVRKLEVVGNYVFVLTPCSVERIEITPESIVAGHVPATSVMQLTSLQAQQEKSFSDLYVSESLALIASSFGLLRTTNAIFSDEWQWHKIDLPEAIGSPCNEPVSRLFPISAAQDNLYLLNAHVSTSQTLIYRVIVDDDTVELFPDMFISGTPSFFLDLGTYRNYLFTDGAFIAVSRSAFGTNPAFLQILHPSIKSNEGVERVPTLLLPNIRNATTMGRVVRNSSSGALTVTGDFGVRQLKGNNS